MAEKPVKKVVLAYSGGLDTSIILKWLQTTYGCEVITFTADLGQGEGLQRAIEGGDDHQPARRQEPRAVLQELGRIGHVLDHLHVEDHVEGRRAFLIQGLNGRAQVVDRQVVDGGVGLGRAESGWGRAGAGGVESGSWIERGALSPSTLSSVSSRIFGAAGSSGPRR